MRVTKASAVVTAEKLSPRARQLVAAMFIHKRKFNFKNKREYGTLSGSKEPKWPAKESAPGTKTQDGDVAWSKVAATRKSAQ